MEEENATLWIPKVKELIMRNTQANVVRVYGINNNRHFVFETDKGLRYQMLFKREFFNSFGRIFNKEGIGESVNKDWVEFAISNGIHNFLFIHIGRVYICPVREFYDYAIANNTIRKTYGGEITMSVPVRMLRSWK